MAMTKAEAAKLTQDLLLRGVIETVVKESELLRHLPFLEVTGTAVTYNREATMPAASFYEVGDTWTEATPTFTPVTAELKILGGDADVDNFLQASYAEPNDIEAEVIASRAKAVSHKFSRITEHKWITWGWGDRKRRHRDFPSWVVVRTEHANRDTERFQYEALLLVAESG